MDKEHAKTIAIPGILDKLNIQPKRISNNKALYLSPIRNEKTPSFWVYLDSNSWYDYGQSVGGDSIEFARHYLKYCAEAHTMVDALRWLRNMSGDGFTVPALLDEIISNDNKRPTLVLTVQRPLQHIALVRYLEKRGILLNVANKYIKEVRIINKTTGKSFLALGFKNENDGFELRNPFFKGCIKSKTITFIRGRKPKPDGVHIFEAFMDYVSVITQLNGKGLESDTIVLNSVSCLKNALPYLNNYGYKTAYTWMDNDAAGHKATDTLSAFFKTQDDVRHIKMNSIYAPHKDVNEWHMHTLNLPPLP